MKKLTVFSFACFLALQFAWTLKGQEKIYPSDYQGARGESVQAVIPMVEAIAPRAINATLVWADSLNGDNTLNGLGARGYAYTNNSDVPNLNWFQGNDGVFPAFEGPPTGYVAANFNATAGSLIDLWLFSPAIDVMAGDTLSFWERSPAGSIWPDSLRVYYSAAGDTTPAGSWVLLDNFQTDINNWTMHAYELPSSGATARFAFRYHVTDAGPLGSNSNFMGIDLVQITRPDAPPAAFFDDFEAGAGNWVLTGTWGTTTAQSNSPVTSLTESPGGNYGDNLNITATMATGVDLSSALDANLSFYARYDIELGFDYMYVEASSNGSTWIELHAFDGTDLTWTEYSYTLAGFVGNPDVKVRFRFFSDGGFNVDGMYIDDVTITADTVDNAPPLIVHAGPEFYEGSIDDFSVMAELLDISGVAVAQVHYQVDGGDTMSVGVDSTSGDEFYFLIPAQAAGAQVDYWIEAEDNVGNSGSSSGIYSYIAGNHLVYDDGIVDFVNNLLTGGGAAVRMTIPAGTNSTLAYALIRNYTDINRPNDSIEVHVWADAGGFPGTDLITPFKLFPEATLANTSPMTRVDLRPYSAQLSGLSGDFHIGFLVPTGSVWITQRTPGTQGRTANFTGTWIADSDDYHFRAVMGDFVTGIEDVAAGLPTVFALHENYPNPFNPSTTIKYDLPATAKTVMTVYNILGQEVRTLVNGTVQAGFHSVVWDGKNNFGQTVSSGVYVYRIQAGNFVKSSKMMFLK